MNYKLIITAVSAFALGLRSKDLHAQITPPAYVLALNDVKDEAATKTNSYHPAESHRRPRRQIYCCGFNKTTTLNEHHRRTAS